jgi:hypothetical protein
MSDMTDIQAKLAGMDEAYENTTDGQPEDGDYQAVIERFDFFEGRDGTLYLKTELKIAHDPIYDGATVEAIHNLSDEDKLVWTKKYLGILGYEGKLSQLPSEIGAFVGTPVDIAVKRSAKINDFTGLHYLNVFINRKLGEPLSDVPAKAEEFLSRATTPVDDSGIPF